MTDVYGNTATSYSLTRRPDPRIAARIVEALGDSSSVVNVGAGTGSYEPRGPLVVAVEPSAIMIRQRPADAAPVIQSIAEALPFVDGAFDTALAVLTLHHWTEPAQGLAEMRRVAKRRVVVLTWDQDVWESFWLIREYLPCIRDLERPRAVLISQLVTALGGAQVVPVPIPHDCLDGFHGAFWRRPEAYLDPRVRVGISTYTLLTPAKRNAGLRRLATDLASGAWHDRHGDLFEIDKLDLGYRLVVAEFGAPAAPGLTRLPSGP